MGEARRKARPPRPFQVQQEPGSPGVIASIDRETLLAVLTGTDAGDQALGEQARLALYERTLTMAERITRGAANLGLVDPRTGELWTAWRPDPQPKPVYGVDEAEWDTPTGRAAIVNIATGEAVENEYMRMRNLNVLPGIGRRNKVRMKSLFRVYSALKRQEGLRMTHLTASFRFTGLYDVRRGCRRLSRNLSRAVWPVMRGVAAEFGTVFDPSLVATEVKYKGRCPDTNTPLFHIHAHAPALHQWMEQDKWREFIDRIHAAAPGDLNVHAKYVAGDLADEVVKYCFDDTKDNDENNPNDGTDGYARNLLADPLTDEELAVLSMELYRLQMHRKLGGFLDWAKQFQPEDIEVRRPDGTIELVKKPAKHLKFVQAGDGVAKVYVMPGQRVTRPEAEGVRFDAVMAEVPPSARGARFRAPAVLVANYTGKLAGDDILRAWDAPRTGYVDYVRSIYNARVPDSSRSAILDPVIARIATMHERPDEVPEVRGHPLVTVAPAVEGEERKGPWSESYAAATVPPAGFDRVERVGLEYDRFGAQVRCRAVWRVWRKAVTVVDTSRLVEACGPAAPEEWYEELGGRFLCDFVTRECRVERLPDGRPCLVNLKTLRVDARSGAARARRVAPDRRKAGRPSKVADIHDNCPNSPRSTVANRTREGPRAPPSVAA